MRIARHACFVAEHVRMTADHLVANGVGDVVESEGALLLRHPRVEHDLQQQVAEFVFQIVKIAALYGVGDFVGFFNGVRRYTGEGLLKIPRATVGRIAQARHDSE